MPDISYVFRNRKQSVDDTVMCVVYNHVIVFLYYCFPVKCRRYFYQLVVT